MPTVNAHSASSPAWPTSSTSRGEAHRRAGRSDAAREALERARASAERIGSLRIRWPILLSLARVAEGDGEAATATRLREESATIVRGIAASLAPLGLAERFLACAGARGLAAITLSH